MRKFHTYTERDRQTDGEATRKHALLSNPKLPFLTLCVLLLHFNTANYLLTVRFISFQTTSSETSWAVLSDFRPSAAAAAAAPKSSPLPVQQLFHRNHRSTIPHYHSNQRPTHTSLNGAPSSPAHIMRVRFLNCIKIIMKKYCSLSYHLRLGLLILLILHCNVQLALAHRQGRPSSAPSSSSSSMSTTMRGRLGRADSSAAVASAASASSAISTGRDRQISSAAAAAAAAANVGWEPDCCYKTGKSSQITQVSFPLRLL